MAACGADASHATRTGRPFVASGQPAGRPGPVTTRELRNAPSRTAGLSASATILLVATLGGIYIVSQFLRNSVGVIAPDLAARTQPVRGRDRPSVERLLLLVRAGANSARHRARPLRPENLHAGLRRRSSSAGAVVFAGAHQPAGLIAARALIGLGCCCYLMAPLALYARYSRATILHPGRPPDRRRHARNAARDRAACLVVALIGWRASFLRGRAHSRSPSRSGADRRARRSARRAHPRRSTRRLRESFAGLHGGHPHALDGPAVRHAARASIRASCWWSACGAGRISRISTATA